MLEIGVVDHIGIRVIDAERARAFYALLGFEFVWQGGPEPVMILRNRAGVELNLILNGVVPEDGKNVLMDRPTKHPGYTHMALQVASIDAAVAELGKLGVPLTGGPLRLGDGIALFVRDPDGNVIELRQPDP